LRNELKTQVIPRINRRLRRIEDRSPSRFRQRLDDRWLRRWRRVQRFLGEFLSSAIVSLRRGKHCLLERTATLVGSNFCSCAKKVDFSACESSSQKVKTWP